MIVPVTGPEQRAVWNTLLHAEPPRGGTRLVGAQMRYLIGRDHGLLGAVGFAAAALYLRARDRWMRWTEAPHPPHLFRVVGLSRFLIRPGVRCPRRARQVLGHVLRRLPADLVRRYGYRPWGVETLVGPGQPGTCFRAAGFKYAGPTTGRGRQARSPAGHQSKQSVFVYELDRRWRRQLGGRRCRCIRSGRWGQAWTARAGGSRSWGRRRWATRGARPAGSKAWAFCPGGPGGR